MNRTILAAAFAAGALAASGASAQSSGVVEGVTMDDVVALVQNAGYAAELTTLANESLAVITRMSGFEIYIYPYGCEPAGGKGGQPVCDSLQLRIALGIPSTAETMAAWNAEYRYTRAFLSPETGNPRLAYDFLVSGITEAQFERTIRLYNDLLDLFLDYIE